MMQDLRPLIHAKIVELANGLGNDGSALRYDESIPATGILDSSATLALILWLEDRFDITISQEDLNIENLGTIDAISGYLARHSAAARQGD